MRKWLEVTFFSLCVVVGPLIPVWPKLLTWEIAAVTLAGFYIYLSQPAFQEDKMMTKTSDDRMSALGIVVSFLSMFLIPIVDYGYFQNTCTSSCLPMKVTGLLLVVGGLTFRTWAIRSLGKFFTATVEIQCDHRVIDHGPYRYLRHPSYTGAFAAALGIPLILTSWVGCVAALILSTLAYAYRISVEERALAGALGEAYVSYQKRTWRLVPWIY